MSDDPPPRNETMMGTCRHCGTKITSHWDRWVHLVDGNDGHTPEPKGKGKR